MADARLLHAEVTDLILKSFYHVYNTLGYGFLEKVYQRAMISTLRKWGLTADAEVAIKVYFEGELVGSTSRTSWLASASSSN
jgi:GxxExxY protein